MPFRGACSAACGFVLEAPGACGLNPYVGFAKADLPRVSATGSTVSRGVGQAEH
jgi:hypothetical protein